MQHSVSGVRTVPQGMLVRVGEAAIATTERTRRPGWP